MYPEMPLGGFYFVCLIFSANKELHLSTSFLFFCCLRRTRTVSCIV